VDEVTATSVSSGASSTAEALEAVQVKRRIEIRIGLGELCDVGGVRRGGLDDRPVLELAAGVFNPSKSADVG